MLVQPVKKKILSYREKQRLSTDRQTEGKKDRQTNRQRKEILNKTIRSPLWNAKTFEN